MFDMMAGTSTGSIIAAALAYPHPDDPTIPKYFMQEIMDIYTIENKKIFVPHGTSYSAYFIITMFIIGTCTFVGYYDGKRRYDNFEE